jgi:ABC-type transporter Mla subunit MlaD
MDEDEKEEKQGDPPAGGTETPPAENSTIRQMREQLKQTNKALADAQKALKDKADAELSELERLTKRVQELEPLTEAQTKLQSVIEKMLEEELTALPEDKKEAAQEIIEGLEVADQLKKLRAFKRALPTAADTAPPKAAAMGAAGKPATGSPASAAPKPAANPEQFYKDPPSLASAFGKK